MYERLLEQLLILYAMLKMLISVKIGHKIIKKDKNLQIVQSL